MAADLRAVLEDGNEAWKVNLVPVTRIPWLDSRLWRNIAAKGRQVSAELGSLDNVQSTPR